MRFAYAGIVFCLAAFAAPAQTVLTMPEDSQRAVTSQRFGLTDVTVTYHRPLVNGRTVWGALVPMGKVWRAGANENTTIEFSTPVTVAGSPLAKGIYGLHMIPSPTTWTVIFSKNAGSWGSFSYNQEEDALRVTVTPQPGDMHEALAYDFDSVKSDSATLWLRWEKLAVPIPLAADTKQITVAGMREELRGRNQYTWAPWDEAASYCLVNKINLAEAVKWADQSIQYEDRFENEMTKSRLLAALHRDSDAAAAHAKAMEVASTPQLYQFARQLQIQEKKQTEAMEIFRSIVKRSPDTLQGHMAQARLASHAGDFPTAIAQINAAHDYPGNSEAQKQAIEPLIKRLEAKQDINL